MTTSGTITWFAELDKSAVAVAGGKGANLGELTQIGLPVPPGFVITTAAYDAFVDANQLRVQIIDLATHTRANDPATLEVASDEIRALFMQGQIPADRATEIIAAYQQLAQDHGPAVAVRSSATAEDLPEASFAGQQDTYLNVQGDQALLAAVKQCWASLWTARAIAYRMRQAIDPSDVSLAVVVQHMIPADLYRTVAQRAARLAWRGAAGLSGRRRTVARDRVGRRRRRKAVVRYPRAGGGGGDLLAGFRHPAGPGPG